MEYTNTKLVSATGSGRVAVMARLSPQHPWLQVDSVASTAGGEIYCKQMESDSELREEIIREWRLEDWAVDAPLA
jgi:hypothetical protein